MRPDRKIFKLSLAGVFAALAYISTLVFYITVAGFLTYDVKDALITICAMMLGPIYGVAISLIVSLVELITVSATGFWGFLMNFISSSVFAAVASFIYKKTNKLSGAFWGLGASIVITTVAMVAMNIIITPIYVAQPREVVVSLIPTILLPFNLTKAILNAGLVLAIYKPLITALRSAKLLPASNREQLGEKSKSFWSLRSLVVIIVAVILISVSLVYMIWGLGGSFGF